MKRNAWRGKQTWRVRMWHVGADCSKYTGSTAAATGNAWSPTVDSHVWRTFGDGEEADQRRLWALKSAVYSIAYRRDTTVLSRADTCTREQQASTGSSPVLSTSAVGRWVGQGWKMASKKPRFLGFLKSLKSLKIPKFRFFSFFAKILCKSFNFVP